LSVIKAPGIEIQFWKHSQFLSVSVIKAIYLLHNLQEKINNDHCLIRILLNTNGIKAYHWQF